MIFKYLNRRYLYGFHAMVSIVLSLYISSLNAEVSVNNIENNDKVASKALPVQNAVSANNVSNESNKWVLYAEQWEMTRSGESILSLPVLNTVINKWLQDRQKKIEIQYPGGEEGEFWVHELTDWLVSLGIPSDSMLVVAGSGADDMIKFNLVK